MSNLPFYRSINHSPVPVLRELVRQGLTQTLYRHNLILWLGDSVTDCFLWLFSQFPFPSAHFYTVVRSDSMTMVIGFYDYFPSDLRWKTTFLVLDYSCLRLFQLMMLTMLPKTCQTRGNLKFQLMILANANKDEHHLGHILPIK